MLSFFSWHATQSHKMFYYLVWLFFLFLHLTSYFSENLYTDARIIVFMWFSFVCLLVLLCSCLRTKSNYDVIQFILRIVTRHDNEMKISNFINLFEMNQNCVIVKILQKVIKSASKIEEFYFILIKKRETLIPIAELIAKQNWEESINSRSVHEQRLRNF
jgi:hypothetical protein